MMHGRGKSDEAIVAVKPANKAERSAAELVERLQRPNVSFHRLRTSVALGYVREVPEPEVQPSTPTGSKLSTTAVLHRCRGHLLIIPAALLYAGPLSK